MYQFMARFTGELSPKEAKFFLKNDCAVYVRNQYTLEGRNINDPRKWGDSVECWYNGDDATKALFIMKKARMSPHLIEFHLNFLAPRHQEEEKEI